MEKSPQLCGDVVWKTHCVMSLKHDVLGNAVEEKIPTEGFELEIM